MGQALGEWSSIPAKDAERIKRNQVSLNEERNIWPLVRYWVWELYRLRNDYVHGNDISKRSWAWNPSDHLLLGAYVFPLLTKTILAADKKYILSNVDQGKLLAIDGLLDMIIYSDKATNMSFWCKHVSDTSISYRLDQSLKKRGWPT